MNRDTSARQPLELYTRSIFENLTPPQWQDIVGSQYCPLLGRTCIKTRKSDPRITIGTCTVQYQAQPIVICPVRFLQRRQIFLDCLHLLEHHVPGNQIHILPEIAIPGGSVDFFVASVFRGEIRDYLGLEIQTLDTTGTVWPSRQRIVASLLRQPEPEEARSGKSFGMNWKMTAKTILVQLHHKVETLELLKKKLVLVVQDRFFQYVCQEFNTEVLRPAERADAAQFHVYALAPQLDGSYEMEFAGQYSTTTAGIEQILGLRHTAEIDEEELLARLRARLSDATLLRL